MEKEIKPEINIPKADEKGIVNVSSGEIGNLKKKFEKIDQVLFGVMLAVVLSMVAIIISAIGLFLDQMRVNNITYKDYSQKIESVESTQRINQELLKQVTENQETIKKFLQK